MVPTKSPYAIGPPSAGRKAFRNIVLDVGDAQRTEKTLRISNSRLLRHELEAYLDLARKSDGYKPLTKRVGIVGEGLRAI